MDNSEQKEKFNKYINKKLNKECNIHVYLLNKLMKTLQQGWYD